MTVEQKIRKAMKEHTNWTEGEVNAAQVFKGYDSGEYGWTIKPFNGQAIFLGANEAEAISYIENWVS